MTHTVAMTDEKYEAMQAEIERLTAENERLRAAGLGLIQHEHGGSCMRQGGVPCSDVSKCECYLEFQDFIDQQQQDNC